jgi:hypothetical protein
MEPDAVKHAQSLSAVQVAGGHEPLSVPVGIPVSALPTGPVSGIPVLLST